MWSHDQNLVTVAFLWQKLSESQWYWDFTRKNNFFEGCSWFKFNNLELALGMTLEFYTSVVKVLKLKVKRFWDLISTFVGITAAKLVGGLFAGRPNLFKTFIKVRCTLSGKISSGKSFRWWKFLSPNQYFVTFPCRKVIPQI